MAPKKLTDCPENLREAIDWLIQVRHGGDGRGLGELAKALKKLIEEAITKATKSLEVRRNQLECPEKYYSGKRDESYCTETEKQIHTLKSEIKGLNGAVKSKKDKELKKLQSEHDEHITNDHPLSEEERQNKIEEQNNNFKKLKGSLEAFIAKEGTNGECEKILTNLCSGLEAFLGFNSDSKGYDGTGIVYSDLDRLCDGVMAFLYHVLKGVNDNENLKPYEKKLESTVRDLHTKLNKGRTGLHDVIDIVNKGIAAWLVDVEEKSEAARKPLEILLDAEHLPMIMKGIGNLKSQEYNENSVKLWLAEVNQLPHQSTKLFDALKNLDKNLQILLYQHFDVIRRFVESYKDSAVTDVYGLMAICRKVDGELSSLDKMVYDKLETHVKNNIEKGIQQLKIKITTTFKKDLELSIAQSKQTLTDAEMKAKFYLDQQFERKKLSHFDERFNAIGKLLDEIDKVKNSNRANSKLHDEVSALEGMISEIETQLQLGASKIGSAINVAVQGINLALGTLDGKVKEGLEKMKQQINPEVKKVISALKKGVENVGRGDSDGLAFPPGEVGAQNIISRFQDVLGDDGSTLYQWGRAAHSSNFRNALASLDKPVGNMQTDNFQAFRNFLEQLLKNLNANAYKKSFFDALADDITKKVNDTIGDIKVRLFTAVFDRYKQETTKGMAPPASSEEPLHSRIDKIKTTVAHFFDEGKIKGSDDKFNLGQQGPFGEYHTKMQAALSAIKKTLSKITTLESIPEAVKTARENVAQFIEQIKGSFEALKNEVVKALEFVTMAEKNLTKMIDDINLGIDDVHTKAKQYIDEFYKAYLSESKTAARNIKKESLNQFASSRETTLKELHTLVEEENAEVTKIIETDLETGIKGMMQAIYGVDILNSKGPRSFRTSKNSDNLLDKLKMELEKHHNATLLEVSRKARDYIHTTLIYAGKDIEKLIKGPFEQLYRSTLENIFNKFTKVFQNLTHYDSDFLHNFAEFKNALDDLNPQKFGGPEYPVLDFLRGGLLKFWGEWDKVYISTYSMQVPKDSDAHKYAKICFTIVSMLHDRFVDLYYICGESPPLSKIFTPPLDEKNDLGVFFSQNGYSVATKDGVQNGELQNSPNMDCDTIGRLIVTSIDNADMEMLVGGKLINEISIMHLNQYVFTILGNYLEVCHLCNPSTARYPCTIRDMLSWLAGLPYTLIVNRIKPHCDGLLADKTNSTDDVLLYVLKIDIVSNLATACKNAYNLLVTIQGNGRGFDNADYTYALNFCDNSRGFHYPTKVPDLLDMLKDICKRLLCQLYFLYSRCRTSSKYHGWYECSYGFGISSYQPDCKDHSDSKCKPKSPLQAHLMDGLPGFMPHNVTSVGCKSHCSTCPKSSPGMPCITPMGFWDLAESASITGHGIDICNMLYMFCRNATSPLCVLLRSLQCLLPHPPKSIAEMFAFYSNIMQRWNDPNYSHDTEYKNKIDNAIKGSFPLAVVLHKNYEATQLTDKLRDLYCSDEDHNGNKNDHNHRGLQSLSTNPTTTTKQCSGPEIYCAPYLQSLCLHANHMYPTKHTALYLSWFTYLAWEFWELVDRLLKAFINVSCKTYGCSSCNCASGKHGVTNSELANPPKLPDPSCHCPSIVECHVVLSTFYQYGFTFRIPKKLSNNLTSKSCEDFVKQLTKVLYNGYFSDLFREIDNFLFAIRMPFFYTTVALWLLSLLYLLHIMVIRLDLLHIKSHLHSPSSHRIAAQSLLAAARVGKLAKISYLQP